MEALPDCAQARSKIPSPLKSPLVMLVGLVPAEYVDCVAKKGAVTEPVPSNTEIEKGVF